MTAPTTFLERGAAVRFVVTGRQGYGVLIRTDAGERPGNRVPTAAAVAQHANWSSEPSGVEPRHGGDMVGMTVVVTRVNHGGVLFP